MKVAVLGASNKPDRYSYRAVKSLIAHGHEVFPVNPSVNSIDGAKVYRSLKEIHEELDTITVYLGKKSSNEIADEILKAQPKRIVFNPGAENAKLAKQLEEAGINVVNACTLVMLQTDQF